MDAKNYTQKEIEKILANRVFSKTYTHVVLGRNNPNTITLNQRYINENNVLFHTQTNLLL